MLHKWRFVVSDSGIIWFYSEGSDGHLFNMRGPDLQSTVVYAREMIALHNAMVESVLRYEVLDATKSALPGVTDGLDTNLVPNP